MSAIAARLFGPPTRRRVELRLILLAVVISMAAYAALNLAQDAHLSTGLVGYGGSLAALFIAAHLAVRWLAPAADPLLLPLAALLNGLGLVVVRRIDYAYQERAEDAAQNAPQQLIWTAVAVVVFVGVLIAVRDHRALDRYRYTFMVVGLVLLLLPALPGIGRTINGARLWVRVGPMTVQPSEIAKLALIVFFASYLVAKREVLSLATRRILGLHLPRARDLGPVLLAWLASLAVLVRGKDLGTSLLFFGVFLVMLYISTERTSWLLIGVLLFASGAVVAYRLFGHVRVRFQTWIDPFADPQGDGFQLLQSLFGLATGGLLGTGLGRGRPAEVPYSRTDFIFSAIGEELGLVGVAAVLLIYLFIVARGMRTALGVRDEFGKLLAAGLSFSLALQVFVVVGGVTRLIPLTGLTLPFLSYGGSSLVANYALIALLLRISDSGRTPTAGPVTPAARSDDMTGEMTAIVSRGGVR
ncbi:MAG TPA: FtsW/RodA/SpoVE family cell cycle protein [Mycobacteriales bacterium]|jgi:cell division protein FtsW (lipid II flippase)|nr:FtsW/RodA/SpoVE family cell cycle protein [Mycobacteriales bacterium]